MIRSQLFAWRRWTLRLAWIWRVVQIRRRMLVHWLERGDCRLARPGDSTADRRSVVNCPACLDWRARPAGYLGRDWTSAGSTDRRLALADRLAALALRQAVREALRAGLAAGLPAAQLADQVAAVLEESDPQRAARIARAETEHVRKGRR